MLWIKRRIYYTIFRAKNQVSIFNKSRCGICGGFVAGVHPFFMLLPCGACMYKGLLPSEGKWLLALPTLEGFSSGKSYVTKAANSGVNLFHWGSSAAALRRELEAGTARPPA